MANIILKDKLTGAVHRCRGYEKERGTDWQSAERLSLLNHAAEYLQEDMLNEAAAMLACYQSMQGG